MSALTVIYLVDNKETERAELETKLVSSGYVVSSHSTLDGLLAVFDQGQIGCLILDTDLPEAQGSRLLATVRENGVDLPVIFVSSQGNIPLALQLVRQGAMDFLEKPVDASELAATVEAALQQHRQDRMLSRRKDAVMSLYTRLTPREREIMVRVAAGESNRIIAARLGLSPRTVEVHRARVMEKMRADSLSELISKAVACGVHSVSLETLQL